jgi:hypothetical protein
MDRVIINNVDYLIARPLGVLVVDMNADCALQKRQRTDQHIVRRIGLDIERDSLAIRKYAVNIDVMQRCSGLLEGKESRIESGIASLNHSHYR